MKMTCRLHVGYEIVGYKKKMCVAVIPSILEAALAGVTPANNIGHRTKIAMDNLLRTLPMVLAKQACTALVEHSRPTMSRVHQETQQEQGNCGRQFWLGKDRARKALIWGLD